MVSSGARRDSSSSLASAAVAPRAPQRVGHLVGHRANVQQADLGARPLAGLDQVVVEAGQLHRGAPSVHDLGADPALAHQHAPLNEVADGSHKPCQGKSLDLRSSGEDTYGPVARSRPFEEGGR
jgi:hypothetical protein